MVKYGTYLTYLCSDFFLKENGAYTVQEVTAILMPEVTGKRQRINANNRVRRSLDQLVFDRELLKEKFHLEGNISTYKYQRKSYEFEHAKGDPSPLSTGI